MIKVNFCASKQRWGPRHELGLSPQGKKVLNEHLQDFVQLMTLQCLKKVFIQDLMKYGNGLFGLYGY